MMRAHERRKTGMSLALTGGSLTIDDVVHVARDGRDVTLDAGAIARMTAARAVVERAIADDVEAYGVTTGVGVRKSFRVTEDGHDALLLRQHLIAQGPALPRDVVRAAALRLANALAQGLSAARPELAERLVRALNEDDLPAVRSLGSIGQADLAQTADLAVGLLGDDAPASGEAIALLNQNAFSTGHAALAAHDARVLLDTLDVAAALDLEALGANRESLLHPELAAVRQSRGLEQTLGRLRALLDGSRVSARSLQDPLSFRTVPQLHGAARDALAFTSGQIERELNAHQSNPLVLVDEKRLVSVGNFEAAALATALDLARIVVAQVLTSAAERTVKLLQAPLTGLPEGLAERPGLAESALSELGIAVQAIAAEARLLAQPVSLELVSTTQAEGIEDRTTMAPLAARRLSEQLALGRRVLAIELLVSAQACDLRGEQLGSGTAKAHALVRDRAPFVAAGDPLPELEPLVELVVEECLLR
jgi:histidine ammonia-lyase